LFDGVQHQAGVDVIPREQTNRTLEHGSSQQHQRMRQQHNHPHESPLDPVNPMIFISIARQKQIILITEKYKLIISYLYAHLNKIFILKFEMYCKLSSIFF